MQRKSGFDGGYEAEKNDSNSNWTICDQGHEHWGKNGAAGMLLRHVDDQNQERYFLQQRGPYVQHPGTWSTPGGAIEDGETPHGAAMREATEELGDFPAYNLNHMHTLDHGGWAYYTVTADVPHPFYPHGQNWDPYETNDAGWFTPHEIDELPLHPGFRESWDQYKPNQRPDPHREIWSSSEESTLQWQPGGWGKGMIIGGQLHTWPTQGNIDRYGPKQMEPHHGEYLARYDIPRQTGASPGQMAYSDPIVINPEGYYTHNAFDWERTPDVTRFAQADRHLRYDPRERRIWSHKYATDTLWYNPGGHAWKDPHTRRWHQDWGRGILTPDQQMYTWPSDEMTHHERIMSLGLEDRERGENTPVQFKIDPEGQIQTTDPGYWYNKAHPWIENQLTQYDPRLKATPFDPEIYGRDWDPQTGEWAGRRTGAASTVAWKPGQHGKGIVTPTGAVYKWSVWPDRDGDPSHSQVVSRMGYDRVPEMAAQLHYFGITPTGGLRYVVDDSGENSPPEVIQHVMNSLQPATEKMSWDEMQLRRPQFPAHSSWHEAGQFIPQLEEQEGSTEPQEVANPEDHWPEWGERPPDWPSGTHTDYDWALTRV